MAMGKLMFWPMLELKSMVALTLTSHGLDGRNLLTRSFTFGGLWAPNFVNDLTRNLVSVCPRKPQRKNQRHRSEE
eukprot:3550640-Amphidinium_carterae.1